jgi:uncharacterized membrane protein YedE/YeeE
MLGRTPRTSPITFLFILAAAGLLVGTLVAAVSVGTAAPFCPSGFAGEECRGLVVTLAQRAGLVAGGATVVMALLVVGLLRMLAQDDRDRAQRAREAYLASRR